MEASEHADRMAITELVNQSVAGVLRKDMKLWGGTWAPLPVV